MKQASEDETECALGNTTRARAVVMESLDGDVVAGQERLPKIAVIAFTVGSRRCTEIGAERSLSPPPVTHALLDRPHQASR